MTLLTAGALTDPQLPATASNVCATDAWLGVAGRCPPKQKSWLCWWLQRPRCFFNIKTRALVVLSGNINNTVSNDIISGDQIKSCLT